MSNKNGETQKLVLNHLRDLRNQPQLTCEEIANDLGLSKDQVKHALTKLHKNGKVLRAQGRPARYTASPQVVNDPLQPHTAPLHGQMPTA